ncbi:TldD/PmbA family protein [Actinocorallia longicatena]|uniref:TldD/PmbA family protein n=1 Tax=Actinocorallia longicatena TaxID=111803 RepID=A0ABP6Q7G7_9ACTN
MTIDPSFNALPLRALADAALTRAQELGVEHVDFRLERIRSQTLRLKDGAPETALDADDIGLAVRVVKDGTWGFASGIDLTTDAAAAVAEQAVAVAKVAKAINREAIELAPEPSYGERTWISAYEIDPFTIPTSVKIDLLADWSKRLLAAGVDHVDASLLQVKENKYFASANGTITNQQRVRIHPQLTAVRIKDGAFDTMRTIAPPAGRGWEYVTGTGWDFDAEIERIPGLLEEKLAAPSVEAGVYDVVVDPSNLWLTIHESIGHATELDRALGYEAAYAGTSFATPDKLGTMQYGSKVLNITGDRTVEHGLSTIGWDDDGVQTQKWDIVTEGLFTGYQTDRRIAHLTGQARSNGCAFADSPGNMPLQRMANVSLAPAPDGPSTEELISRIDDGIYIVGDKSWSIDMQRYNFQFTGQRFFKITNGRLDGQLRDVAYQAVTTDFWNSLEAVGGPQTYVLGGAFNCGKGQPGQVAPVSHGAPSALFRGVNILNALKEAGK